MDSEYHFKKIVSLLADPVRAVMLWNLLDGRALTATELAIRADVSAQNASMHLKRLIMSKMLSVENQGRHRYYRISKPEVAYAIESLASLVQLEFGQSHSQSIADPNGIRYCRTCYDHLAGKVGVMLTDHLLKLRLLMVNENAYAVTAAGQKWFSKLDIEIDELKSQRRSFARQCLDWSERRYHLAGALGAALFEQLLSKGWVRTSKNSRAVTVTEKGRKSFYQELKIIL